MKKPVWHLWEDTDRHPEENMRIDAALLERSEALDGAPLLRLYGWNRPSVTIGYTQKESAVPDRGNREIAKRPTGGGVVFHDNDLTYTVVAPAGHWIIDLDRVESYRVIHRALTRALASFGLECLLTGEPAGHVDRATMRCFATPTKYDVLLADSGLKVAGAAQRRTKKGLLHQGSVALERVGRGKKELAEKLLQAFEAEFGIEFEPFAPEKHAIIQATKGE